MRLTFLEAELLSFLIIGWLTVIAWGAFFFFKRRDKYNSSKLRLIFEFLAVLLSFVLAYGFVHATFNFIIAVIK